MAWGKKLETQRSTWPRLRRTGELVRCLSRTSEASGAHMGRLENKVAIVTGGARGLGKLFCLTIAEEGAKVVIADILEKKGQETAQEVKTKGGSALSLKADVTSEEETTMMAEATLNEFGRIDILVNNAAMFYGLGRKPFWDIPASEWDQLIAVNLKGPFLCTRAVIPQMRKQKKGKIINLSLETAFTGSKGFPHYVTSKGGIISFTRSLAAELGQYGIRVDAIAPGLTDTEAGRTLTDDISKYDVSRTPLGRLQEPQDLVGAMIFFASDESDFITGQALVVDEGRYMHWKRLQATRFRSDESKAQGVFSNFVKYLRNQFTGSRR